MIKILLACSAGMSTSLLEKSIKDYAASVKLEIEAIACPSDEAKAKVANYDCVLLGPQVRFMLAEFQEICARHGKSVEVIPPNVYALAKGKETVDIARRLTGK